MLNTRSIPKSWITPMILLLSGLSASQAGVVVYPNEVLGTSSDAWSSTEPALGGWYYGDIRADGTVGATKANDRTSAEAATEYPGSSGSLELVLTSGSDKAGFNQYFVPGAPLDSFPLSDLDGLAYDWYRNSSSTNPPAQAPSLFIWIDGDGDLATVDTYGLKYEPVYNGYGSTMPTDSWQTSVISSSTNLWSWNAPGMSFVFNITLADWKSNYPNAVVTGLGIDVGSGWNGLFLGNVDFVEIDRTGSENDEFFDFQVAPGKVVIGDCETEVVDYIVTGSTRISDLIEEYMNTSSNHGEFVKQVAALASSLVEEGIISGKDRGALVSCAAKFKD